MTKFKVVHIVWSLNYGGIETMLVNIANAQNKEGADVHVIILDNSYKRELVDKFANGVTVHLLHREVGSRNPVVVFKLNLLLLKTAPDAIHMHYAGIIKMLWFKKHRHIACSTLHDLPHDQIRSNSILSRIIPLKDIRKNPNLAYIDEVPHVYAISQAVKDDLLNKYGVGSTVVSNGIIVKDFRQRAQKDAHTPMRAIQVSRLVHNKKGQDLLIRAVAKLKGSFTVDFIGVGESIEYLQQLTEEVGASPWVRFLGLKSQAYIAEHLYEYDLFIQPSRIEGFGLTVAEALAACVPTLVSSGQGPAEVLCGNTYGWIFRNGDLDDLVTKMEYIRTHYDEALRKAETGLKYVLETYDVSITANKYLNEYKHFLK